jgi:hypothetical protein
MFLKLLEIFSKNYYYLRNSVSNLLFVESEIVLFNNIRVTWPYYYYLLNYYSNSNIEYIFNNYFNLFSKYNTKNYYEISYRKNGMICTTIVNGTMVDVFNYTRKHTESDKLITLLKCNLIINATKTNIRQIMRKYDTSTKLYDILYFNFHDDIDNDHNTIEIELGKNNYNIKEIDKDVCLCDV